MIKIDYCSDLHLEFDSDAYQGDVDWKNVFDNLFANSCGDYLVIAGDLFACNPRLNGVESIVDDALVSLHQAISERYKRAFFVLGNHDYWYHNFNEALGWWSQKLHDPITVLDINDNPIVKLDDNTILIGSTGWTELDNDQQSNVEYWMNDYRYIRGSGDNRVRAKDTSSVATATRELIENVASENPDKTIIVATHHAPSFKCKNLAKVCPEAYFNKWDDLIERHSNIRYWIHGHVHQHFQCRIGNCDVCSNARGYFWNEEIADYFSMRMIAVAS